MSIVCRSFLPILLFLFLAKVETYAQTNRAAEYRVVFYNCENLFDPFDDPATNDNEYTPKGKSHWTMTRLNQKVMMIYRAIVSAADGRFPDVIGLAEIENLWILEYLIKKTPLKEGNYGIIHKESPDPRGIDVALLYRKERVVPVDFDFIPVRKNGRNRLVSRDIIHFKAKLNGETINLFVNHWPSRSGGYVETLQKRNFAATILRHKIDSLCARAPESKLLLMGDFNATPDEECLTRILGASLQPEQTSPTRLVNLAQYWLRNKTGTIRSKGRWEIFDQFVCSDNLLHGNGLQISVSQTTICTEDFLLEEEKRYLGKKPFRTYMGPIYHGGISDHLPISTQILSKE